MRFRSGFAVVVRAGIPGLLLAVALSREGRPSVQVWLAAAAVWMAGTFLWEFVTAAALEPDRRVGAWRMFRRRRRRKTVPGPRGVRTLSLLVTNALTNPRFHANALRPRLAALAEHYFPIRHGLDLEHDRDRVAESLGDVAWLIDRSVIDRTPTTAELERFLSIVLDEKPSSMSATESQSEVA